jgi:hypothetical protein
MTIWGILFSGEEREAMAIWDHEHPPPPAPDKMSWRLMLSLLIKIPHGITTPRALRKYKRLERFNDEGTIRGR